MTAKAVKSEWRPDEGVLVIYGDEGPTDGIALPIGAIPTLAAHARRFISGAAAKQTQHAPHEQWHLSEHCTAQTYDVGLLPTTQGEKVSLILDRGLETHIGFAIEPEHARELGQQILDTGNQASKTPPAKN